MKKKRIVLDMAINLLGTGIPLVILQLIVYPIIAQKISDDAYGLMQSSMSVVYLVGGTLGGALSTTRLMQDYEYKEKNISGDFNFILICSLVFVLIGLPLLLRYYLNVTSIVDILLVLFIGLLNCIINYIEVGLRLNLQYNKIFLVKVIGAIGYLVGFLFFVKTVQWQWVFILSIFPQIIYCIFNTSLFEESIKKTVLFKPSLKVFSDLTCANLLNKSLTYFDKFLLYPLLGGAAVSVYFAANVFGKLILQTIEPITNVILSYLSKQKSVGRKTWKMAFVIGIPMCTIMYCVCLLISEPILTLFYPQWVGDAMKIVPIATLTLSVSSFINILYPITLKTFSSGKQMIISGASLIVYILLALLTYKDMGLVGCSLSLLVCYLVKFVLIMIFYYVERKGNNDKVKES